MIVRVLGSAAGGGVPQWNCGCANCAAARAGRAPRRTQSAVAVSPDGDRWLLLNCSPDVAAQIEAYAPLQPRTTRSTPLCGVLLTDANVDHLGGLAVLRQAGNHRFVVRSSAVVAQIAGAQPAFAPFAAPPHRWVTVAPDPSCEAVDANDVVGNAIEVRVLAVPGTTPGYDGRRSVTGAVVAYELREPGSNATLLFAPVYAGIDERLAAAIGRATVAFLDGSFYSDDELVESGLMPKRARALGHLPVGGPDGSLARLTALPNRPQRTIFTHLNNSNPMLDPSSDAASFVRDAGFEIAEDGLELRT
ncbi:MAG TPA: MBL fold metallo-hydrolase [Candidatus Acidoferrales bacterium]|nr:MBL fold metallo-hydrolase [Candidatus Acidoferrales bacterium]